MQLVRKQSFHIIGHELQESSPTRGSKLDKRLAEGLARLWGWPAGVAQSRAQQARQFWDEAGVFVAQGTSDLVTPRTTILAEIAEAGYASDLGHKEQIDWTNAMAQNRDASEVLLLAMDLSTAVADRVLIIAEQFGHLDLGLLVARSLRHRGSPVRTGL